MNSSFIPLPLHYFNNNCLTYFVPHSLVYTLSHVYGSLNNIWFSCGWYWVLPKLVLQFTIYFELLFKFYVSKIHSCSYSELYVVHSFSLLIFHCVSIQFFHYFLNANLSGFQILLLQTMLWTLLYMPPLICRIPR